MNLRLQVRRPGAFADTKPEFWRCWKASESLGEFRHMFANVPGPIRNVVISLSDDVMRCRSYGSKTPNVSKRAETSKI